MSIFLLAWDLAYLPIFAVVYEWFYYMYNYVSSVQCIYMYVHVHGRMYYYSIWYNWLFMRA